VVAFAEYESYDALGLSDLVRRRKVSPLDLVDSAIERIEKVNPRVNAVVLKMFERARDAASGELPDGPFRGVPFLLKDIVAAFAGVPMASGSRFCRDWIPSGNSRLVDRFLRAGVIVVGKTNTSEFSILPVTEPEMFGPTRNPWNLALSSGGSSGGSAAAVAARMVPMASGGDAGGSIRIPSSCCGVFGLKPSRGRTPVGPFEGDVWEGLFAEHVLTRSVRDSAAMLDATSGPAVGELHSAPNPDRPFLEEVGAQPGKLRIAFSTTSPLSAVIHPDCRAALEDAVSLLRDLGHELVEANLDIDGTTWMRTLLVMTCGICAADVRDAERRVGKKADRFGFGRGTWLLRALGESFTAGEYAEAVRDHKRIASKVATFVADYDAWLTPTLGAPPPRVGAFVATGSVAKVQEILSRFQLARIAKRSGGLEKASAHLSAWSPFAALANAPGLPSMNVPLHWSGDGVPIGVMLTGRFADEATLLRLGAQLEQARPWADRRPPI
jgi:amidase